MKTISALEVLKITFGVLVLTAGFGSAGFCLYKAVTVGSSPVPTKGTLSTGESPTEERIGGCQYLLLRGVLTHRGDCDNPIHLKGGALLEDWEGR